MQNDPLTKQDFEDWLVNHYAHLKRDVSEMKCSIASIKGKLTILIPLTLGIIGGIIGVLIKLLWG